MNNRARHKIELIFPYHIFSNVFVSNTLFTSLNCVELLFFNAIELSFLHNLDKKAIGVRNNT